MFHNVSNVISAFNTATFIHWSQKKQSKNILKPDPLHISIKMKFSANANICTRKIYIFVKNVFLADMLHHEITDTEKSSIILLMPRRLPPLQAYGASQFSFLFVEKLTWKSIKGACGVCEDAL